MSLIQPLDAASFCLKKEAWKKVLMLCGAAFLGKHFGLTEKAVRKWIEEPDTQTNYAYAVWTRINTGLSLNELYPEIPELNDILDGCLPKDKRTIQLNKIIEKEQFFYRTDLPERVIIVDQNNELIFGYRLKLELERTKGKKYPVCVLMANKDDFLSGKSKIANLSEPTSNMQKVAILLSLEDNLGERRGRKKKNDKKVVDIGLNSTQFLKGKTEDAVAKIAGWKRDFYRKMKLIYFHAIPRLVEAVEAVGDGHISVNKTASIVRKSLRLPADERTDYQISQMVLYQANCEFQEAKAIEEQSSQPASQEMLNEYEECANEYTN